MRGNVKIVSLFERLINLYRILIYTIKKKNVKLWIISVAYR